MRPPKRGSTAGMKRPVVLIVSVAAGAFLVAGAGASAHTIQLVTRSAGTQSSVSSDEASGARTESPEPSEAPEPADTETDEDADDNDAAEQEQHDSGSGEHDSGGDD